MPTYIAWNPSCRNLFDDPCGNGTGDSSACPDITWFWLAAAAAVVYATSTSTSTTAK